ncbi:iron-sulfur cluster-binding domain-containing protein [Aquabacterium sp. CECT 9606]|uniref:iron-sulfur cluster-binding domain-containing protein n=1 Tax=Aquabacterium sp. CECT 9606 TaxID=2845822 RepID=UPI001E5496AB|nr:iron-sulfur cluster-binding domain-containing protein [Aquabacterium sp. CECT 9606]CAH0348265.1 1,2-phenylacetyl-CoA epoxidase, subunit E [Aquabacterium sp. CECT 9606]
MLDRALARVNGWALDAVAPEWVDYVVSNTMTDFNRWFNGFLWTYELKALVEQVIDEAPGVKTFVLRPNQHWRGFQPGQHVEVFLPIGGDTVRRYYSLSGLPNDRFSITVKQTEGGQASRWMHQHLRAGMPLKIGHPQGRFCHQGQAKVLFLCAGSGITPCHSMVSALLAQPEAERPDIQVMAQFRQASEVIFWETLQQWAQDGLNVTTALSGLSAEQVCLPGLAPRLDAVQLQKHCPDLLDRDIYLCGPIGFMTQMIEHLRALNVDLGRVHTERFVVAEPPSASPGAEFEIAGAEVFFQHLNTRITLTEEDQGKTLLQLGLDHGVLLESGCCQGMCGTCKLTVHEGQVSGNSLGKAVYLCTAYPASRQLVLDA